MPAASTRARRVEVPAGAGWGCGRIDIRKRIRGRLLLYPVPTQRYIRPVLTHELQITDTQIHTLTRASRPTRVRLPTALWPARARVRFPMALWPARPAATRSSLGRRIDVVIEELTDEEGPVLLLGRQLNRGRPGWRWCARSSARRRSHWAFCFGHVHRFIVLGGRGKAGGDAAGVVASRRLKRIMTTVLGVLTDEARFALALFEQR